MNDRFLQLINENKNMIYKIAHEIKTKYSKYYYDIDDLFQVGVIGLRKADIKYDARSPTKFSSFAYFYIFGEIYKYVVNDRNIRLSSEYLKIYKAYLFTTDSLTQALKRPPSFFEISEFMEMDPSELACIVTACEYTLSPKFTVEESNAALENIAGYDEREEVDNRIIINDSIKALNETEQKIIELRYYRDYSQSETAKIMGMSQAQISRKEGKALQMMKRNIAA